MTWERRCRIYNGWHCTNYYYKRTYLGLTIIADIKVSEQGGIVQSNENDNAGLRRRLSVYKD